MEASEAGLAGVVSAWEGDVDYGGVAARGGPPRQVFPAGGDPSGDLLRGYLELGGIRHCWGDVGCGTWW